MAAASPMASQLKSTFTRPLVTPKGLCGSSSLHQFSSRRQFNFNVKAIQSEKPTYQVVQPINGDPFIGSLETPVTSSPLVQKQSKKNGNQLGFKAKTTRGFCISVLHTAILHSPMVSTFTWLRYLKSKAQYSAALGFKNHKGGLLKDNELTDFLWKHLVHGRMTFLHWNKGEEMAPTISGKGATLLVRRLPIPDPRHVCVGDVVVLKNPEKPDDYLVRRLAATGGYEMASTDQKDESFVLEQDECWVVAENEKLKVKEANDSRTFGPIQMTNIVGRVLYCLRSAVDHGRVQNSPFSMQNDSPVLEVELDVDEMAKSHKA